MWRLASASNGGASLWRVCYQQGLPRLVSKCEACPPPPIIGYNLIWSFLIFSKCETCPTNNRLCSNLVLQINLNFLVCDKTRSELFWLLGFGLN